MAEGCPARRSFIPRNASKKRLQNAEGQHKPLGGVYNDSAQRSARKMGVFLIARRPHKIIPRFTMRQVLSEPDLLGNALVTPPLPAWRRLVSQSSCLVAGIVPGVERQPLKKLAADENALLKLLHRWREEAEKAGRRIERTAVAFEAGRDGFWLARWLRTRSIEAHVIHASSVAVSREHRRAKADRLRTALA